MKKKGIILLASLAISSLSLMGQEKTSAKESLDLDPPKEVDYKSQPNDGKGIAAIQQELADEARKNEKDYYVNPKSYGTTRINVPQTYVKPLNRTGISAFKDIDWIEAGLDYRTRYEHREN